tara:strand:- start:104 stop:1111 length:1008 start_codon:yes stop_codon:yes gene_type:complete
MLISQRGTSFTATGEENTLDRWQHTVGSGFTFDTTTTQDSSAPDGFSKSLKITPDGTSTPTGSANGYITYKVEANDCNRFASGTSSAKKYVLSFYAKTASQNNGHKYTVQIKKQNSGGTFYHQNVLFTITSSWQRFTVAFSADTSNNIITGNGIGIMLEWHLVSGPDDFGSQVTTWTSGGGNKVVTNQSNFMDNTSNEFYLTGVQLEASDSDVATDFEHRSYAEELLRCQRYYFEVKNGFIGGARGGSGGSLALWSYPLPTPLRASPTITALTSFNMRGFSSAGYSDSTATPSVATNGWTKYACHLYVSQGSHGIVDDRVASVQQSNGIALAAEL